VTRCSTRHHGSRYSPGRSDFTEAPGIHTVSENNPDASISARLSGSVCGIENSVPSGTPSPISSYTRWISPRTIALGHHVQRAPEREVLARPRLVIEPRGGVESHPELFPVRSCHMPSMDFALVRHTSASSASTARPTRNASSGATSVLRTSCMSPVPWVFSRLSRARRSASSGSSNR
jgi:hypothetical protein